MMDSEITTPFSVVKPPMSREGEGSRVNESLPIFDEGYGSAPTGEPPNSFTRVPRSRLQPSVRPSAQYNIPRRLQGPEQRAMFRTRWKEANTAAEVMLHAAQHQDQMAMTVAADDLEMALSRLWDLRATRDIDWKTILNHTQGMLKQLFAAKRVESLTEDQCESIVEIVAKYLGPATKTIEDLNAVLRLIEDIGFDPYGAISGEHLPDLKD